MLTSCAFDQVSTGRKKNLRKVPLESVIQANIRLDQCSSQEGGPLHEAFGHGLYQAALSVAQTLAGEGPPVGVGIREPPEMGSEATFEVGTKLLRAARSSGNVQNRRVARVEQDDANMDVYAVHLYDGGVSVGTERLYENEVEQSVERLRTATTQEAAAISTTQSRVRRAEGQRVRREEATGGFELRPDWSIVAWENAQTSSWSPSLALGRRLYMRFATVDASGEEQLTWMSGVVKRYQPNYK